MLFTTAYYDTDSVIASHRPGDYVPPLGDLVGELSDEISGAYGLDARITSFCSTGCKSYALTIAKKDGTPLPAMVCSSSVVFGS